MEDQSLTEPKRWSLNFRPDLYTSQAVGNIEIKSNNCHGNTQNNELAIEKEKIVSRSMPPPMATQFLPLRTSHLFSGHFKLREHTSQC